MRGIICPISEQVVSFAVLSYSFLSRCSLSPPSSCFRESQDGVRRSGIRLSCLEALFGRCNISWLDIDNEASIVFLGRDLFPPSILRGNDLDEHAIYL